MSPINTHLPAPAPTRSFKTTVWTKTKRKAGAETIDICLWKQKPVFAPTTDQILGENFQ
jgi:hypothetical protein